jgi:hypothetical protein
VREAESRGFGLTKKSAVWSQSPVDVAKSKSTKKIGNASVICTRPWPAPDALTIDSINTSAIADRTTIVQADRAIQHCCFALAIGNYSTDALSFEHCAPSFDIPVTSRHAACLGRLLACLVKKKDRSSSCRERWTSSFCALWRAWARSMPIRSQPGSSRSPNNS